MKTKLLITLFCLYSALGFSQFQPASYTINGYNLPYQVMFPDNYDQSQKYPLVIFLHGAGERGKDNEKQLTHGKDFLINNFHYDYPAIVIAPQCPEDNYWSNVGIHSLNNNITFNFSASDKETQPMSTLISLINSWLSSGMINKEQVYVGGLSMGGMGTFELLWRMPKTFAGAFPICGGADINKLVSNVKNTAIWMFHGAEDSVVPVKFSQNIYDALEYTDNDIKYTEYPDVNHNSWDEAFQEKHLVFWLFSHKKSK